MTNKNAKALGSLGGKARAKKLTADRRQEIARQAVTKRWDNYYKNKNK